MQALLDCENEANLISKGYAAILSLIILDTSLCLATINKKEIRIYGMVIVEFEIHHCDKRNRWFEKPSLIADILQSAVLGMFFLNMRNPNIDWVAHTIH